MTKARELSDYTGLQADITAGDTAARAGRKNLLLNGSMQVAQRGTSVTSITGNGFHTCDRWYLQVGNLGTHTVTQETLTSGNAYNDGFTKAFRVDCTTADASPAASDHIFFQQKIEAQNLQHLAYGTSGAKALTLSFWVKSNKTGTYEIMHYVADSSRQVNSTYTINSANTWEKKVLSIPADTGGSGINNDNEEGFRSLFYLAVGSQRQSGSTPTSWQAYGVGNEASSQTVNIGDNTANDWAITGYQLEVGSVATDFEHRSYGEELALCQRYYNTAGIVLSTGTPYRYHNQINLPVEMRASPSITTAAVDSGSGGAIVPTWDRENSNSSSKVFYQGANHSSVSSGRFTFDAEL